MNKLKKDIRKTLIEAKREKENRLNEAKSAEERLRNLLNNTSNLKNFDKLPFEKQWEIGVPLMREFAIIKQSSNGEQILTEGGILDLLGSIFGTTFSSGFETIFESMLSSLFNKLGFSGFLADAVVFFFSRNPGKIIDSFRDCRSLAGNLGQAIMEAYIAKLQREYKVGGAGMDFVRNALMETLENSDFGKKLAGQFENFICGFFDTVKSKGTEVVQSIAPKPAAATA